MARIKNVVFFFLFNAALLEYLLIFYSTVVMLLPLTFSDTANPVYGFRT